MNNNMNNSINNNINNQISKHKLNISEVEAFMKFLLID